MNTIKTFLLLGILTVLFVFVGGLVGGEQGMMIAFVFTCIMNLGSYWFSDKIVLAMYQAKPISQSEAPEVYSIVQTLCERANLPLPKICVIPSEAPNAFATGRDPQHAVVAVTRGILNTLNREELSGVLAHELCHVKHRDILISSIAAIFAGAITMLANMARWSMMFSGSRNRDNDRGGGHPLALLAAVILVPIAAFLIQLAISRSREYDADAGGAELMGTGEPLARALEKLESSKPFQTFKADPSTAHLFIVNPLRADVFAALFSTHPSTKERVARLRRL